MLYIKMRRKKGYFFSYFSFVLCVDLFLGEHIVFFQGKIVQSL